ncbi:MAG: hypothetical protein WD607_09625 [Candidatus Paceibacterota bacterium]
MALKSFKNPETKKSTVIEGIDSFLESYHYSKEQENEFNRPMSFIALCELFAKSSDAKIIFLFMIMDHMEEENDLQVLYDNLKIFYFIRQRRIAFRSSSQWAELERIIEDSIINTIDDIPVDLDSIPDYLPHFLKRKAASFNDTASLRVRGALAKKLKEIKYTLNS